MNMGSYVIKIIQLRYFLDCFFGWMKFDEVFVNPVTNHNPSHSLNLAVTTESFIQNSAIKPLSVQKPLQQCCWIEWEILPITDNKPTAGWGGNRERKLEVDRIQFTEIIKLNHKSSPDLYSSRQKEKKQAKKCRW